MVKNFRLAVLLGALVFSISGSSVSAAGVLRVAISPENEPFEFTEFNSRRLSGFNIDLWTEIARRIGRELELVELSPGGIPSALEKGMVDAAVVDRSHADGRTAPVAAWLETDFCLLVRAGDHRKFSGPSDLRGRRLAVNPMSPAVPAAAAMKTVSVSRGATTRDVLQLVRKGQADAAFVSCHTAAYFRKYSPGSMNGLELCQGGFGHAALAPAVLSGRSRLSDEISSALAGMHSDGYWQQVFDTWFLDGFTPEEDAGIGPGVSFF